MKNSIPMFIVSMLLMAFAIFSGCESSENKVEDAEANVTAANEALDAANAEYLADIKAYRKEKANLIAANDSIIVVLKSKIANEKKDMKASYEKNIYELEQKNKDLKRKMDNYKDDGIEEWESFKREFSHDMDELGNALKDMTVNNKK